MKKIVVSLAYLVLLHMTLVAGEVQLSLTILSPEYSRGETVQAVVTAENPEQPLTARDIVLRNEIGQRIPISPFLTTLNSTTTVITFTLESSVQVGQHTLNVEDMVFIEAGKVRLASATDDVIVITSPSTFSFFPAAILLNENTFSIKATNTGEQATLFLQAPPHIQHPYTIGTTLTQGSSKIFSFAVLEDDLNKTTSAIDTIVFTYNNRSYSVPLFRETQEKKEGPEPPQSEEGRLVLLTPEPRLERSITSGQVLQGAITLKNERSLPYANITLSLTGNLEYVVAVNPTVIDLLQQGMTALITITVNEQKNALLPVYEGDLVIASEQEKIIFPMRFVLLSPLVNLTITQNESEKLFGKGENQPGTELTFFTNVTIPPTERKNRSPVGIYLFLIILTFIVIAYILGRKKVVKKVSLSEYVNDLRKRL